MLFIKYGFTWALTFVGMRLFPTSSAPYGYNMPQILHGSVLSKNWRRLSRETYCYIWGSPSTNHENTVGPWQFPGSLLRRLGIPGSQARHLRDFEVEFRGFPALHAQRNWGYAHCNHLQHNTVICNCTQSLRRSTQSLWNRRQHNHFWGAHNHLVIQNTIIFLWWTQSMLQ